MCQSQESPRIFCPHCGRVSQRLPARDDGRYYVDAGLRLVRLAYVCAGGHLWWHETLYGTAPAER